MSLPSPSDDRWPASMARRLDGLCDGFEAQWQAALQGGPPPVIDDLLSQVPEAERADLRTELLALDEEYRRRWSDLQQVSGGEPGAFDTVAVASLQSLSRVNELAPRAVVSSEPAIASYEILATLGKGGMGIVYKARQVRLNRLVALKRLLNERDASPQARERFLAEAEAVARLRHPNIVQIYEMGIEDGQPFFSMEFCEAGSLADQLAVAPLQAKEAARLVGLLAGAVQAAHDVGIIHRDLKPANVLLAGPVQPAPALHQAAGIGTLVPRISDFGLARVADSGMTASGAVMGSPSYMPPEQTHDASTVDARSDVYALGAILYECLTGRPPFRAATVLETMHQVRVSEPVPPRRLQPAVPRDLETICLKCLEKAPARRYPTATALADDLARFGEGRAVSARPISVMERSWRWARRNRSLAGLSTVSGLAVLALLGLAFWFTAQLGAEGAARAAADLRAETADRVAKTHRYFGLVNRVRERNAQHRPGWVRESLADLADAAKLPDAADHRLERRSEAAFCLGAIDVRPPRVIRRDQEIHSIAWQPGGRQIALGMRSTNVSFIDHVTLENLDRPGEVRKLAFAPRSVWDSGRRAPDIVTSLAFSPDGRWLVAGTRSGRLHCWDLTKSDSNARSHDGHKLAIESLVFALDGLSFYSVDDHAIKRWSVNAPSSKELATVPLPHRCQLAVHPTEGWLACHAGNLHCLQAESLRPTRPVLDRALGRMCWMPDGCCLAISEGRSLHLLDASSNLLVATFRLPDSDSAEENIISELAISPDGALLVAGSQGAGRVKLWDVASGRLVADLVVAGGQRLAFAPDGRSFAVTGERAVNIYPVDGLQLQTLGALHGEAIESFAIHPDGRSLTCLRFLQTRVYELAFWSSKGTLAGAPMRRHTGIADYAENERHPLAIAAGAEGWAHGWPAGKSVCTEPDGGSEVGKTIATGEVTGTLNFGHDGRLWGDVGTEVRAWDFKTGQAVANWKNQFGGIVTGRAGITAVAAGQRWVVAAGRDGSLRVLPAGMGALTLHATQKLSAEQLYSVAQSEGGDLAATGSDAGQLALVRLPDASVLVRKEQAHTDRIESVAVGPGGLLASGGRDNMVKLWRWDGAELMELVRFRQGRPVRWLAFHPDGVTLAVLLRGERGVRLWHLDRLRQELVEQGLEEGLADIKARPLPSVPQRALAQPIMEPAMGPNGLKAELFNDFDLRRIVKVRQEMQVDAVWKEKPPDPLLRLDGFSIRWSGWLKAPMPGRYALRLRGKQIGRLWLDDKLLLDGWDWRPRPGLDLQTEVELGAKPHAVRIEYRHAGGDAALRFSWSRVGGFADETVPREALYVERGAAERPVKK